MSKRSFLSQLLLRLLAVTGLFLIMNGTVCMLSQTFDASIHRERAVLFFGIAAVLITVVSMIDRRKAAVIGHIAILCVFVCLGKIPCAYEQCDVFCRQGQSKIFCLYRQWADRRKLA